MKNLIKREIRANLKSLLFWCLGAFGMTAVGFLEYTAVVDSEESIAVVFDLMPRVARVMFGVGRLSIDEPQGYFACLFLWICLITFAHAAMLGGGLLSKEERDKTAEFLNTRPISRKQILTGKMTVGMINIFIVWTTCLLTTLACFLPLVEGIDLTREVCLSMLGMLFGQVVFLFAGICISMLVKNHKKAVAWSGLFVLLMYLAAVAMEMAEFEALNFLTPFRAFNAVDIIEKRLEWPYLVTTLVITVLMGSLSMYRYQRRNLQI